MFVQLGGENWLSSKTTQCDLLLHDNTKDTVNYNVAVSRPFQISSAVKQGSILGSTLFGILFSMMLSHVFRSTTEGAYVHNTKTETDGKLFNLARLKTKTKVPRVLIREVLFAVDAALTSHTEEDLHKLMARFSHALNNFD